MRRFVLQRWASFCWDGESKWFTDPQFFLYLRTTDGTSCTLVLFVNTSFSHRGASGLTFCCFRSCHTTSPWLIQQANDTDGVIWLCSSGTRCKGKIKHPTLIQSGHSDSFLTTLVCIWCLFLWKRRKRVIGTKQERYERVWKGHLYIPHWAQLLREPWALEMWSSFESAPGAVGS